MSTEAKGYIKKIEYDWIIIDDNNFEFMSVLHICVLHFVKLQTDLKFINDIFSALCLKKSDMVSLFCI